MSNAIEGGARPDLYAAPEQVNKQSINDETPLMAVRAKMICNSIEATTYNEFHPPLVKVQLGAIYGKDGENADFAKATPSGACWMQIDPGVPASKFFKPGRKYYVTFIEAAAD